MKSLRENLNLYQKRKSLKWLVITAGSVMKKKFVIDTSVYITYAAYNKIYRLVDAINRYNLEVFINDELI